MYEIKLKFAPPSLFLCHGLSQINAVDPIHPLPTNNVMISIIILKFWPFKSFNALA